MLRKLDGYTFSLDFLIKNLQKKDDCSFFSQNLLKLHYVQNLSHEGAHMPWVSKGQACDPILADD